MVSFIQGCPLRGVSLYMHLCNTVFRTQVVPETFYTPGCGINTELRNELMN